MIRISRRRASGSTGCRAHPPSTGVLDDLASAGLRQHPEVG